MPKAVKFDGYGGVEVLRIEEIDQPVPGPGQVLVRVRATAINPGEAKIREGLLAERWPTTFPSGEGSDLAGVVEQTGPGVTAFTAGDEVLGWTDNRASHAELAVTEAIRLTRKPAGVSWEVAGSLFVVGTTAYAMVRAVGVAPGDTVVVSGAAGGVGTVAAQLARNAGGTVIGLASESNHDWLGDRGIIGIRYGEGVADRIRAASGGKVDAFLDTQGSGYVELALDLGVAPERIDTIADFAAVGKYGVKSEGSAAAASAEVLAGLAGQIEAGTLEIPIARTYPLDKVQDAYRELEHGHTRGKIVLSP
jgi:NADPH:quinone reductase-like Zn-dependent oxidoreductase